MVGTLHLFTAVKDLYTITDIAPYIAPSLQELVGETLAVWP